MSVLTLLVAASVALADPADEARARALDQEIRCVQCENEPIAQSTADIAEDMRALVRERIAAGDSDGEIRGFFRERYGDFVLFRPPFDQRTWLLWLAPLILAAGGFVAIRSTSGRPSSPPGRFAPEESER